MDRLKDFITANREEFDEVRLPEGHRARFERKLPKRRKSIRLIVAWSVGAVAAAVALLLFLRLPGGIGQESTPDTSAEVYATEMRIEFDELCMYYRMRMGDLLERLNESCQQGRTPEACGLREAGQRIVADCQTFERTVVPTLPCTNEGIFVLTRHYGSSLESLSFLVKRVENEGNKE